MNVNVIASTISDSMQDSTLAEVLVDACGEQLISSLEHAGVVMMPELRVKCKCVFSVGIFEDDDKIAEIREMIEGK